MRRAYQAVLGFGVIAAIGWVRFSACNGDRPGQTPVAIGPVEPAQTPTATKDAAAVAVPDPTPVVVHPPGKQHDINHVLGTGQSLSVGTVGGPPLTLSQPYKNLMFNGGVMPEDRNLTSFIPLVEGDTIPNTQMIVETHSSGFANLVSKLATEQLHTTHDLLVSQSGVGGEPYARMRKGGPSTAYPTGMAQVTAARDIAKKLGKSYIVTAVTNVHGETDAANVNTDYLANLLEWQSDYEKDLKAITGQSEPIPMFESQISSWGSYGIPTTTIPIQQLAAHVAAPGKVILVGSKYHLPYASDGIHLSNEGYRHMGEDYAKAYRKVVLEGGTWEPVRPKKVTRDGAVITVVFFVPSPPLVIDKTLVTDPGHLGFEYTDDASPPAIANVTLTAPDTVTITLARAPSGPNRRIRYAFTAPRNGGAGATSGPRGNVRDSDPTVSRHGYPLFNWCVTFDEGVP